MVLNKKITILQVLPDLNSGGVERGTLEINKYLANKGHRTLVLSNGGRMVRELKSDKGVSNGGRMVRELKSDKGEHFKLGVGKKNLFVIFTVFKLINFIKKNKIDIVHARSRLPAWICFFAINFIKKNNRPIFITTVHGPYSVNFYSSIMTKGERVIVVSEMIREYVLKNYKIDRKKIVLNYRGVSDKNFPFNYKPSQKWLKKWHKDFPQTKNKIILTLPGRITRWKGQDDFIIVLKEIIKKNSNVHALIVGDKDKNLKFTKELKEIVKKLGLEQNISFVGNRKDIKEIMSISRIVFSLSKEPEAFGRISLESLSLGIPVIAYSHGGVKEQLIKLLPKGLIKVGNIYDVVNLALRWIAKPPKIKKNNFFTLKKMLQNTLDVYEKSC